MSICRSYKTESVTAGVGCVHSFSLRHDDECNGTKTESYHVMAPTLDYETKPWSWSQCSRDKLTEFLEYVYQLAYPFLDRLLRVNLIQLVLMVVRTGVRQ